MVAVEANSEKTARRLAVEALVEQLEQVYLTPDDFDIVEVR